MTDSVRKKLVSFTLFDDQNSLFQNKLHEKSTSLRKVYLCLYDFNLITESGNCFIINKFAFSAPLLFCYAPSATQRISPIQNVFSEYFFPSVNRVDFLGNPPKL